MTTTQPTPPLDAVLARLARLPQAEREAVVAALAPAQAADLRRCLGAAPAPRSWPTALHAVAQRADVPAPLGDDAQALAALDLQALPAAVVATALAGLPARDAQALAARLPDAAQALLASHAHAQRADLGAALRAALAACSELPRATAQPQISAGPVVPPEPGPQPSRWSLAWWRG